MRNEREERVKTVYASVAGEVAVLPLVPAWKGGPDKARLAEGSRPDLKNPERGGRGGGI